MANLTLEIAHKSDQVWFSKRSKLFHHLELNQVLRETWQEHLIITMIK